MFTGQNTFVSLITWIWVSMSQKYLPKQLRHLVSFAGTWLLQLGVLRKLHTKLWFGLNKSMHHPFWSPHSKLQINQIEKVQRTAARWTCRRWRNTSSDSEMLHELEWHLLRPGGAISACFSFARYIVEHCLLKRQVYEPCSQFKNYLVIT